MTTVASSMKQAQIADAAMTPTQVRLMEDTIGACFRNHLLPPRAEKGAEAALICRRHQAKFTPPPEAGL